MHISPFSFDKHDEFWFPFPAGYLYFHLSENFDEDMSYCETHNTWKLNMTISMFPVFFKQLLYFAVDPDPLEGFLRGLSLVANQPMPSSKSLVHLPQPMTEEYGGDVSVPQIQVCKTSLSINDL